MVGLIDKIVVLEDEVIFIYNSEMVKSPPLGREIFLILQKIAL